MPNNKIWDWHQEINPESLMSWELRPNTTLWEFNATPFGKDEELAKARIQEVREKMTIDKIGDKVKKGLKSTIEMNELPLDVLKEKFNSCDSWSPIELSIIKSIINNPKTTLEDLDYYFFEVQEWSEAELEVAKALIAHPGLTQELFDKNYGMAMQKWGLVFDLFEHADWERIRMAKEEKEKINETMQGSVFSLFNKRGSWIIRWDNGRDYIFHFTAINDKNRDENREEIYEELSRGSKVEFKLLPRKELKNNPDILTHLSELSKKPWTGLDPDFMAIDIVVKG